MICIRSALASLLQHTPMFRGKGRIILLLDRMLTDEHDPISFIANGPINGLARMYFDLRAWGQKFAYYYGVWEYDFINLVRQLYKGGAFIDVGSSLGLYVICLGDIVRKYGDVIVSVEPIIFNLDRQKRNVALNELEDVVHYSPACEPCRQRGVPANSADCHGGCDGADHPPRPYPPHDRAGARPARSDIQCPPHRYPDWEVYQPSKGCALSQTALRYLIIRRHKEDIFHLARF